MKRVLPFVAMAVITGCDKTPASIQLTAPGTLLSEKEVPLNAQVLNKGGDPLPQIRAAFAVNPSNVATITASGALRCLDDGDATLTATAGPATRSEPFKCRLVERLLVPKEARLILQNDPEPVAVSVIGKSGRPLSDVPLKIESSDPSTLAINGDNLRPMSVGTAKVMLTAGDAVASYTVRVVRKIKADPVLLNDGARIAYSLDQGKYEAEVKVASSGGHGVTLQWVGGKEDCKPHFEAQEIRSICTIDNAGSMVIENPTTFGMGPAADGVLAIYQVP